MAMLGLDTRHALIHTHKTHLEAGHIARYYGGNAHVSGHASVAFARLSQIFRVSTRLESNVDKLLRMHRSI